MKTYARTSWCVEDIAEKRPDWSVKQCQQFLVASENAIQEEMIRAGHEAIETLLSEQND